jgi:hypothetical protein
VNPVPVPIGILVFLGFGIIMLVVGWVHTRGILAAHRGAIVALQLRVDQAEKSLAASVTRLANQRDNITSQRRQLQEVQTELRALQTSIAPRALKIETSESLPAAVRRRKKQQPKSAFERLAGDDEIIEGGDE